MNNPLVSVVLPVYNGSKFLRESIDSVLDQDFSDFELIIINDGSVDESLSIIRSYADKRLVIVDQKNSGLAKSLNKGVALARGKYIVRQDQDDISLPDRIGLQVAYLDANPDCALVGTRAQIWVGSDKSNRFHDHPTSSAELSFDLIFNNPFVHSSVAFRKDEIINLGGYSEDPKRQPPEDYELWSRISRNYLVANLPDRLVVYRESEGSMSRITSENPFTKKLVTISAENLAYACGLDQVDLVCRDFAALTHSDLTSLSSSPNLKKITTYIHNAAHNISEKFQDDSIVESANTRIKTLQYQFFLSKNRSTNFYMMAKKLKSLIKKIRH